MADQDPPGQTCAVPSPQDATVGVVLCTYDGERYLPQQLDSILAQTRRPDRLLVVDDDSTDGTRRLVETYRSRFTSAGIELQAERNARNLGFARNFSSALARMQAGIVLLCDQDDVWAPEKVAVIESEFHSRPGLGLVHSDAWLVDANGVDLGQSLFQALGVTRAEVAAINQGRGFETLLRRNLVTGATMAVRGNLLRDLLPVPAGWHHDEWLGFAASMHAPLRCLQRPLLAYRQHPSNQLGARRRGLVERALCSTATRRAHLANLADRLDSLLAHASGRWPAAMAAYAPAIAERARHARFRATLPRQSVARMRLVLPEMTSGNYSRYSMGWRSMAADLLGRS